MIHIISGPSCAGKSTFLENKQARAAVGIPITGPVVYPGDLASNKNALQESCLFHYNILRPTELSYKKIFCLSGRKYNFKMDSLWVDTSKVAQPKKAVILVASRSVIKDRMLSRQHIEPISLTGKKPIKYRNSRWIEMLNTVDLPRLYLAWCSELEQSDIEFVLVNSKDGHYDFLNKDNLKNLNLNS